MKIDKNSFRTLNFRPALTRFLANIVATFVNFASFENHHRQLNGFFFNPMQLAREVPFLTRKKPVGILMFKIHRAAKRAVRFTLIGRMDHETIAELEHLIRAETNGKAIVLDLKDLTLVGQSDIDFLVRCDAEGIKLVNCARYVRNWLAREQSGS